VITFQQCFLVENYLDVHGYQLSLCFFIAMITFFVPAMIPFMAGASELMGYMNAIFLVFPPIGAALAGLFKFYFVPFTALLQMALFVYLLLPLLQATSSLNIPAYSWLQITLMVLFGLLSGYNTTMVYLRIRRDLTGNDSDSQQFHPFAVEKASRWAAISNQIGAMIGIIVNDVLIRTYMYKIQ